MISNDGSNSISVFAPNGTYTGNITGNLNRPYSMALGSNGSLYVVNNNNSSVSIFSLTGNLTGNITSNLSNPFGSVVNSNGDLYVANYNTSNISIYSSNGAYLSNIALGFVPYGLAIGNFTVENTTPKGITLAASASDNATLNIGTLGGNDTTATLSTAFIAFGSGTAALNLNLLGNNTLSTAITGGGANSTVNKFGNATTTLTSTNSTYAGTVNINSGTLQLEASLANATFAVQGGTLAGGNITVGDVVINSGGAIAPGSSPGNLTTGNMTWNGNGTYAWELGNATGTAGTGWDFINSTGNLTINANSGNKFTIAASTTNASGFNPNVNSYSWKIADFAGGISGFSADAFSINATGFENLPAIYGFGVSKNGTAINFNYVTLATWIGGTGNWTNTADWENGAPPINGVMVDYAGSNGTSTNDSTVGNINALVFTNNATGSFTLTGGNLIIGVGGITNNSSNTQTVAMNLALGADQTFAANTANLVVSGNISGNSSLTKEGNQTLILSGSNSYTGETAINAGTVAIAQGGSLTGTSKIFVGNSTSNNALEILGSVSAGNVTLSHQVGSNDNTVTVGGGSSPASLTVSNLINVGFGGTGNTLNILGNGTVTAASTWIGGYGESNTLNLTGGVLNSTSDIVVGYFVGENALNITAGGNATVGSITLGLDSHSANNSILVSGSGSALHTAGLIYLGENGASNSLVIENGGKVLSQNADAVLGLNAGSNGNALSINGTSSQFTNNGTLYVGKGGSENTLTIDNGGSLITRNGRIGHDATSSNNTATVSGNGSTWANTGTLRVGSAGSGNTLAVTGGANVTVTGNTFIGHGAASANNLLSVEGTGSVLNLANATVGLDGSNNSLRVADSGTINAFGIQLSGTNSTLQIGNGTAAGTITTSLGIGTGSGTGHQVVFNHTDSNLAFSPILTGNLSLSQIGTGTTALTANNIYTGSTTIAAGTLSLGNNGTTGSVIGDITNNSTLAFNRSDAVEYAGVISGSGSLNKLAANTLTLTADNTYSGNTTISSGTLQLGNGGSIGWVAGDILNNGVLAINRSDDLTLANALTGTGSVLKLGNNTLTYTSTSPQGGTTVNAGTLLVTGSTSSVTVNSNGTLAGSGTAGDVTVFANATISPGGNAPVGITSFSISSVNPEIATLTVGNLTMNGGAIYNWQTTSNGTFGTAGSDWDLIASAGTLTLNATSGSPITMNLSTLDGASLVGVKKASWEIGNFTTGINGFAQSAFTFNASSMTGNDGRYYMTLGEGNKTLVLNYKTAATWNTGSGNWTTASQWENNFPPTNGDEVEFTGSGGISTNNFLSGNLSNISGINFLQGAGAYTVNGNTLQIGQDGIVNSSNQTQTIAMDLTSDGLLTVNAASGNLVLSGVFSGNWQHNLEKTGNQTLTLTGNNTYEGGTIISAGTLALGGTAGAVTGNISVNSGATFAVNRANGLTLGNIISGAGSFAHIGSNKTSITAVNTYTGGTTISSGTLWVNNPQALGNGSVTLNGGKLLVTSSQEIPMGNQSVSTFRTGSIDWNSGVVAFYDRDSSPEANSLTINVDGNFTVATTGNATFDFSEVAALNYGNYTLVNATVVNADNNKFTAVHGPNTTLFGNFTTNNQTVVYTVTGAVSGGTDIQNYGGPNTPVVANYNVTGPTVTIGLENIVNALTFTSSAPLAIQSNGELTVTSGTLAVQNGSSVVSGGTLNTPGNLDKTGAGELNLQSNTNVNGIANVVAGLLSVNAQLNANSVVVDPTATLGGAGVIVAQNVVVNGNLSPGNSPGTLNVVGNLVLTGANSTIIEIASPTNFDRIVVTGTATLGGTLNAVAYGGGTITPGARYDFLQAGSIVGTYDTLIAPDGLRVRFLNSGTVGTLLFGPNSYVMMAINQNQRNVAKALDTFILATDGDRLAVSIALDSLTTEQFPAAFDQIMPGFYESLANIAIEQAFAQTQMLNQRISSVRLGAAGFQAIGGISQPLVHDKNGKSAAEAKDASPIVESATATNWNAWALGTGMFSRTTNLGSLDNYNNDAGGFLVGADYRWSENFVTGLYGGYDYSYAEYNGGGSTKGNSFSFGTYASYAKDGYYADAVIGGGYTGFQTKRSIEFSTIDRTASADPGSGQFTAGLNLGKDFEIGKFTLGPIAGAQYTYAGIGSFTESGAESLDLSLGQQNANSLRTTLGGRIAYTWNLNQKIALIPEVRMFWQHEFLNNPRNISASLDGGSGAAFDFETSDPYRDSVFAGAGVTAQFGKNLSGSVFYNINFGSQTYQSNMVSAGLNFSF